MPSTDPADTSPNAAVSDERNLLYRRVALRILPILLICYVASFVDRTNVSIAQLRMQHDLGFSDQVYGLGIAAFFTGLMIFEIPSNMMLERVGMRTTLLRIMTIWGAASAATMFVQEPLHFYVLRFILGAAEAGFFPGVWLYLTYWFPSTRRARIGGIFALAAPISFMLGSPLSAWFVQNWEAVGGLHGWQWMFLLEGAPTIALGVAAWRLLPDRPATAGWLTKRQQALIESDLAAEAAARAPLAEGAVRHPIADPRTWILCVVGIGAYTLANTVSFWTPQIIAASGVSSVMNTGLLAAIPPLAGMIAMVANGWHSDLSGERRWHAAGGTLLGAVSLALLGVATQHTGLTVLLLCLVTVGHYAGSSIFWSIPALYFHPQHRAQGIAIVTTVGSFGALAAPVMMGTIRTATGSLSAGLLVSAAVVAAAALVLLVGMPARVLQEAR